MNHSLYNILPWVESEQVRKEMLSTAETMNKNNLPVFNAILDTRQRLATIYGKENYNEVSSVRTFLKPQEIDSILKDSLQQLKPIV